MAKSRNEHLGSPLDDFLVEEGIHEEVTAVAWKRVLAWEVREDNVLQCGKCGKRSEPENRLSCVAGPIEVGLGDDSTRGRSERAAGVLEHASPTPLSARGRLHLDQGDSRRPAADA